MAGKSITTVPRRPGRPRITDAEREWRVQERQRAVEANPLTGISDGLRKALMVLADGGSREEAADAGGLAESTLRSRLSEPQTRAAFRVFRELHRDGYRDKLWQQLLGMAGLIEGVEPVADEGLRVKISFELLGMMGDSSKAAAMRVRYGDRSLDDIRADEARDEMLLAGPPRLVVFIKGAGDDAPRVPTIDWERDR